MWDYLPQAFTLRLLPSHNPYEGQYKRCAQDAEPKRLGLRKLPARQHVDLFTDGSCLHPTLPWAAAGVWAVISATHDCVVAKGTLGGLVQTSDLAELKACEEAIAYAIMNEGYTTIWTDSAYAATGLDQLLQDPADPPRDLYAEEWLRIQQLLFGHNDRIKVQHINSHLAFHRECADVEDWTAFWNHRADHEAQAAHALRDTTLEQLRGRMVQHHFQQLGNMEKLVSFHLALAQTSFEKIDAEDRDEGVGHPVEDEGPEHLHHRICLDVVDWQRDLPEHIATDWRCQTLVDKFGVRFTHGMIEWLKGLTSMEDAVAFRMSYLEISAALCSGKVNTQLPLLYPLRKLHWVDADTLPPARVQSPTMAAVLKLIQNFFTALGNSFDFEIPLAGHLDVTHMGVMTPQRGITLMISRHTVKMIGSLLMTFTERRLTRRSCDLARPWK